MKVTENSIQLSWSENRFRHPIQEFEVVFRAVAYAAHTIYRTPRYKRTIEKEIILTNLQPSALYEIKVKIYILIILPSLL